LEELPLNGPQTGDSSVSPSECYWDPEEDTAADSTVEFMIGDEILAKITKAEGTERA
jgi:hypothetical protein